MARKKKPEEHENHERWLVSYADFITLLFAFFVVMYAVSSVNEGKYRVLSESLVAAFRSPMKSISPIQVGRTAKAPATEQLDFRKIPLPPVIQLPDMPAPRPQHRPPPPKPRHGSDGSERQLKQISDKIVAAMADLIKQKLISVRRTKNWVQVQINASVLFPSGSATPAAAAVPTLTKLAKVLHGFPNPIHVEGFTDNVPIHNLFFRSNWELSASRAAMVVQLLGEHGVSPERMVAVGYGEYRPVADNNTPEGRRQNRRVVLVIEAVKGAEQKVASSLERLAPPPNDDAAATDQAQPAAPGGGNNQPSAAGASPPASAATAHDSSRSAVLRAAAQQPGEFTVIAPPIRLPFIPAGRGLGHPIDIAPPAGQAPVAGVK
ncbi:MAG: flagellar motor protein MotD [Gammaproteobacteria bacterium]